MKKLFKVENSCLLSEKYFIEVMQAASRSIRAIFPYDTKYANEAWYRDRFLRKVKGYTITGFKMKLPKLLPKTKIFIKMGPAKEIDAVDFLERIPIETIFVSMDLYEKIKKMKSNACVVSLTHFGMVKAKNKYGVHPTFCLFASDITVELNNDEIKKIESVNTMIYNVILKN